MLFSFVLKHGLLTAPSSLGVVSNNPFTFEFYLFCVWAQSHMALVKVRGLAGVSSLYHVGLRDQQVLLPLSHLPGPQIFVFNCLVPVTTYQF